MEKESVEERRVSNWRKKRAPVEVKWREKI